MIKKMKTPPPARDRKSQMRAAASSMDAAGSSERILSLALTDVTPNPEQYRKHFDEKSLSEMAESLKAIGQTTPIVVRENPDKTGARYMIVAGERRWRASKAAGLPRIKAVLRTDADDLKLRLETVIENELRDAFTLPERLAAYGDLLSRAKVKEVAEATGKHKDWLSRVNTINREAEIRDEFFRLSISDDFEGLYKLCALAKLNASAPAVLLDEWAKNERSREGLRRQVEVATSAVKSDVLPHPTDSPTEFRAALRAVVFEAPDPKAKQLPKSGSNAGGEKPGSVTHSPHTDAARKVPAAGPGQHEEKSTTRKAGASSADALVPVEMKRSKDLVEFYLNSGDTLVFDASAFDDVVKGNV